VKEATFGDVLKNLLDIIGGMNPLNLCQRSLWRRDPDEIVKGFSLKGFKDRAQPAGLFRVVRTRIVFNTHRMAIKGCAHALL